MNLTQEKALFHLTAKADLAQLTVETCQHLANEHPYFAPAQFFLASRLKQEEDSLAGSQLLKTNLYFTNAHWLQFQLQKGLRNVVDKEEPEIAEKTSRQTVLQEDMSIPAVEAVKEMMRSVDISKTSADAEDQVAQEYMEEENVPADPGTENKIASILSSQLADFKKPVEQDAKLDIDANRERLHTVDYFASQGIKIDLSAIPQDKLTTHLRKFTDWLKQIKNVNPGSADLETNVEMENAVMETAKNSNETGEILTEAMADVLVKQGQVGKAIQLYIKLSFLNPEKSSYFATQIEQLKGM